VLCCYVEWSVPISPDSDPPVLPTAGEDADADNTSEEGGPIHGAASPRRLRNRGANETTATPPQAVGSPSRIRNSCSAAAPATDGAATAIGGATAPETDEAAASLGVLDVKDFITWSPDTWDLLCSVRSQDLHGHCNDPVAKRALSQDTAIDSDEEVDVSRWRSITMLTFTMRWRECVSLMELFPSTASMTHL
jgi:hypothetical protein